jgi:hypothetical protein
VAKSRARIGCLFRSSNSSVLLNDGVEPNARQNRPKFHSGNVVRLMPLPGRGVVTVVGGPILGSLNLARGLEQPAVVPPVDPFQDGVCQTVESRQWSWVFSIALAALVAWELRLRSRRLPTPLSCSH